MSPDAEAAGIVHVTNHDIANVDFTVPCGAVTVIGRRRRTGSVGLDGSMRPEGGRQGLPEHASLNGPKP